MSTKWTLESWKKFVAEQQPNWTNEELVQKVSNEISSYPPLVFAGEVRTLKQHLADAAQGNGFLIQGGDCAETFNDFKADSIRDKLKILLQMSVVLTYGASCNVIKVGRIAGQFAKPRSSDTETRGDTTLPSYRGDAVNEIEFTDGARQPNPKRLLKMYNQSAATLNLLRAFTLGGFADLNKVHLWNQEFITSSSQGKKYQKIATSIDDALKFMRAVGISSDKYSSLRMAELYTSHEALLLGYEQALTRIDSISGDWYDCSAHFLWIGNRTRQINGAHVEFLSGVKNPIGIKAGPSLAPDELVALAQKLNPDNEFGRLTVITRMGADKINDYLPQLIERANAEKLNLLWICDPMHGNTYKTETGYKTRHFNTILKEIQQFFAIHKTCGTIPGGIHFELTGDNVTECLGGAQEISDNDLKERYETACDPRLNNEQSLELAFLITELLLNEKV
ncbi:MAG: 3-deoxy-7-phosphoheptulonate synthase class II [Candidatus Marinimicrobia bacterium]|nr:3-deoxy-7-phosphoheptulonate synthase class II [Candidatus Neomarinimicrobiota bacterium]